jgi:hypothetical protein
MSELLCAFRFPKDEIYQALRRDWSSLPQSRETLPLECRNFRWDTTHLL